LEFFTIDLKPIWMYSKISWIQRGWEMLISLIEYAKLHRKDRHTVRDMAAREGFKTARKIGRNWVIEDDEPYPDRRVKTGKYVGWRKPKDKVKDVNLHQIDSDDADSGKDNADSEKDE
jgi:hypothetical protein